MNFTILTKGWGIKSRVFKRVDSESGQIFMIGPPQGPGAAKGGGKGRGKNELPYFDLYQSVGYQK